MRQTLIAFHMSLMVHGTKLWISPVLIVPLAVISETRWNPDLTPFLDSEGVVSNKVQPALILGGLGPVGASFAGQVNKSRHCQLTRIT